MVGPEYSKATFNFLLEQGVKKFYDDTVDGAFATCSSFG